MAYIAFLGTLWALETPYPAVAAAVMITSAVATTLWVEEGTYPAVSAAAI